MSVQTGGPAFPYHHEHEDPRKGYPVVEESEGMTLLDYAEVSFIAARLAVGAPAEPSVRIGREAAHMWMAARARDGR